MSSIQFISKGQKRCRIDVKKRTEEYLVSLEFLARSEKSCSFHHFFEGSLTIFISLSLRDSKTHKINFPTNEEAHHNLNNEQTTTTRKKKRDDDGENDDAFISSGAKSSSSSSVFP